MPVVHQITEQQVLEAVKCGEEQDWEFKSAKGGLPGSLWHTYSAMANTDGGCIVLGVEQQPDGFVISGLTDPAKMRQDFWNAVNDRGKVSVNLLADQSVTVETVASQRALVIRVPRATRHQRPVYVGQNPLTGTYRRNFEGDYHCTENEVGRMLADRGDEPADCRILEGFTVNDLDEASLQQYRQRFSARSPAHPWLGEELLGFLTRLGAWRKDRTTGQEGLTVAGLLMFGKDQAIRDRRLCRSTTSTTGNVFRTTPKSDGPTG
jgi:ATP-dependent DNA helicase RecG